MSKKLTRKEFEAWTDYSWDEDQLVEAVKRLAAAEAEGWNV